MKKILCNTKELHPFDPNLETALLTDASRKHGVGYILVQPREGTKLKEGGHLNIIRCGSAALTKPQHNYAVIELEALAVFYGISKCKFYLQGLQNFEVWMDHKPLLGIWNKPLDEIGNVRVAAVREKSQAFNDKLKWVAGKTHYAAYTLSRSPQWV